MRSISADLKISLNTDGGLDHMMRVLCLLIAHHHYSLWKHWCQTFTPNGTEGNGRIGYFSVRDT